MIPGYYQLQASNYTHMSRYNGCIYLVTEIFRNQPWEKRPHFLLDIHGDLSSPTGKHQWKVCAEDCIPYGSLYEDSLRVWGSL